MQRIISQLLQTEKVNMTKLIKAWRCIILLLIFVSQGALWGQQYEVKSLSTERSKSRGSLFLGKDRQGMIYLASERKFSFILVTIRKPWMKVISSESGALVAEAPLDTKELKNLGYKYITSSFFNNKPVIIVRERTDLRGEFYFAIELDRNLNMVGTPYRIGRSAVCRGFNSGSAKSFSNSITSFFDSRGNATYITDFTCSTEQSPELEVIQLSSQNNELERFSVQLPTFNPISSMDVVSTEMGIYFSCVTPEAARGNFSSGNIMKSHLFFLKPKEEPFPITLELDNNEEATALTMIVKENTIEVAGQLIKSETGQLVGVFTAKLNQTENRLNRIEKHYFSKDFITRYWNEKQIKRVTKRGEISFPNAFKTMDYFSMEDGGTAYILQKHYVERVVSTRASTPGMYTTDVDYYFYYQDVIVCKISPEGELLWTALIPLEEVSLNNDPKRTFVAAHRGGDVLLMHASNEVRIEMINTQKPLDSKDQKRDRLLTDVAMSRIDQFGDLTSKSVLNLTEFGIHFSPRATAVDQERKQITIIGTPRQLFSLQKKLDIITVRY